MDKRRKRAKWGPQGTRSITSNEYWKQPLRWSGNLRVFSPSLADLFEDWDGPMCDHKGKQLCWLGTHWSTKTKSKVRRVTMNDVRSRFLALIDATPNLDWITVTKRPENIVRMCQTHRKNLWLTVSISDQQIADEQTPKLLSARKLSSVLGLSVEPLLGPISLPLESIDWVVVGGESGFNFRECKIEWIEDIAQQCKNANVPCYIKQDSGIRPGLQGRIPDDLWSVKEHIKNS